MNDHSRGSLLTAVLRRFAPPPVAPPASAPPTTGSVHTEYGLLRPVVRVRDHDTARSVQAMLAGAGVRATLSTGQDGRVGVLVFAEDRDRADRLVSWAL